jgi:hypothetical protein
MLEAPLHHLHGLHLPLPAEEGQMLTAAVQPPRFHSPIHDRHTTHIWIGQRCRRRSVTAPPSHDAQDSDDKLRTLLAVNTALRLEKQQIPGTTASIYCDTSAAKPRPFVPAPLQLQVFLSVYDLSHLGTKATARLSYSSGRLHTAGSPFPPRPHRPCGAPHNVSRLRILPHCS